MVPSLSIHSAWASDSDRRHVCTIRHSTNYPRHITLWLVPTTLPCTTSRTGNLHPTNLGSSAISNLHVCLATTISIHPTIISGTTWLDISNIQHHTSCQHSHWHALAATPFHSHPRCDCLPKPILRSL